MSGENGEIRMAKDELPKGWDVAPFEAVAKGRMGPTILAKDLSSTGLPVYSAGQANASWGFTEKKVPEFTRGTIIVSARGSIGFPKIPKEDVFTSTQTTIAVTPSPALASEYLLRFLQSTDWADLSSGAAIPMLTISMLGALHVPVAPLAEQKRISDKLEVLLGRVDACRARLDRVPALLKRFRQSVLAAATSGKLTEEWREENGVNDKWEKGPLVNIVEEIKNGLSPKPKEQPPGTPILRISSVRTFALNQSDLRFLSPELATEPYRLRIGDLLFTRYNGSLEFVGVCALVRKIDAEGLVYPDKLIRVRVKKARVSPEWIEIAASSPCARDVIENKARTSAGQTGISGKDLKELIIPVPSLPEQQEIVRRVEELFAFTDRIESRLAVLRKKVERLTPAVLAKAFRGELVPQDPADEPATALLERLREQPIAKAKQATRERRVKSA